MGKVMGSGGGPKHINHAIQHSEGERGGVFDDVHTFTAPF